MHRLAGMVVPAIVFVFVPTARAQEAWFDGLGNLPGNGEFTVAGAISSDGLAVAAASTSWNARFGEAAIWTAGSGLRGIGMLSGHEWSAAGAVSPEGKWLVGHSVKAFDYVEAFVWSESTGMFGLGFLPDGERSSIARGVSAHGAVIVGASGSGRAYPGREEAFRWTGDGGMEGLGILGGARPSSTAYDVSADGRVIIGSSTTDQGGEAFRWTESGGMVGLGVLDPDRPASSAWGMSPNGRWIAGVSSSAAVNYGSEDQAVLWSPDGEIHGLGFLPGDNQLGRYSRAYDVSNDGRVAVGYSNSGAIGARDHAFLWTPEWGMRTVEDVLLDYGIDVAAEGWKLDIATAVTPDGRTIVGTGVIRGVGTQSWIAHLPIPAPGTLAPLACAGLLAARRRR